MGWASLYPDFDAIGPSNLDSIQWFYSSLAWGGCVRATAGYPQKKIEPVQYDRALQDLYIYITCETLSNIHQEPRLKHVEYVAKRGNLGGCFDMFLNKLGDDDPSWLGHIFQRALLGTWSLHYLLKHSQACEARGKEDRDCEDALGEMQHKFGDWITVKTLQTCLILKQNVYQHAVI